MLTHRPRLPKLPCCVVLVALAALRTGGALSDERVARV